MQFTFLDMKGKTLFIRNDAERAEWTQEEMTLDLEFPNIAGKVVNIGQRVYFTDPATNEPQIYEIKTVRNIEPDHYQQVTAEHICISELSDEHIDNKEITDKTATNALSTILQGTLWEVGKHPVNPTSSGDISRGSVWQAVLEIKDNWNVYIVPRVTLSSSGEITRKLDIKSTDGVWNGVRLSIDKNMLDPTVTYDDSELVTALYGYGGTEIAHDKEQTNKEITFANVVWAKENGHPAKPSGQLYLEDPDATRAYGRDGRKRFGFYQNTDIKDPEILLEKTWQALQQSSKPDISITGTVADLYRLGYADQPIALHDIALVEVLPVGFTKQIQIIRMTTNLLDHSETTLTIGSYLPNIIYINRMTDQNATGSRGGGSKNKAKQDVRSEFETEINTSNRMIQLRAYQNQVDDMDNEIKVQEAKIEIEAGRITQEVTDRRNADATLSGRIDVTASAITAEVTRATAAEGTLSGKLQIEANRITAEVTRATTAEGSLSGRIDVEAGKISAEVTRATGAESTLSGRIDVEAGRISLVVTDEGANSKIKPASIVAAINEQTGQSTVCVNADMVNVSGNNTVSTLAGAMETDANGKLIIKSAGGLFVQRTEQGITSQFGVYDNNNLTAGVIVQKINNDTSATIKADNINISATSTVSTLAGALATDSSGRLVIKSGGGLYVQRTSSGTTTTVGVWDKGNLTGGVMVNQINGQSATKISGDVVDINGSTITISADRIDINGIVTALGSKSIGCGSLSVEGNTSCIGHIYTESYIYAEGALTANGTVTLGATTADSLTVPSTGTFTCSDGKLKVGSHNASWKDKTVVTDVSASGQTGNWAYCNSSGDLAGYVTSVMVHSISKTTSTIHYLGYT